VRDSSLSACTQSVLAAEVGQLDLAYGYLGEAALMDLRDLEHNTRDGVHVASLAGAWLALVAGFGGMRDFGGELSFAPRLPAALTGLAFHLTWRDYQLRVEIALEQASYTVRSGPGELAFAHHGERVTLAAGETTKLQIPPLGPVTPPPRPPRPILGRH
jgi:alpha,alpha-trehalose phosphorylase